MKTTRKPKQLHSIQVRASSETGTAKSTIWLYWFAAAAAGLWLVVLRQFLRKPSGRRNFFPLTLSAQSSIRDQAKEILALKQLAEILNQTLPPEKALDAGLAMVAELFHAHFAWVLTIGRNQKAELSAGYQLPANIDLLTNEPGAWEFCRCLKQAVSGQLNQPVRIPQCERLMRTPGLTDELRQHVSIPIRASGKVVGILNLVIPPTRTISSSEKQLLSALGNQFGGAVERARLFREVHQLAITDPLTGLYNRRFIYDAIEHEIVRSRRYQHELSVAILDLDEFKRVNDTFGHIAGDMALQELSRICREATRQIDVVGRYGGEEIVFLMPETGQEQAALAMERLRKKVEELELNTPRGIVHITISIGIATMNDGPKVTCSQLLDLADQALYQAKHLGRNRVISWKDLQTDA